MRILLLDGAQQVFGAVKSPLEVIETGEINVATTLDYSVANTLKNWKQIQQAAYVAVPLKDDTHNQYHLFSIQDTKTNGNLLTVTGIEEAYDDLAGYGYLTDHRMKQKTITEIAGVIFADTRWTVNKVPKLQGDLNMYYISRLEALQNLVNGFDVEVEFTYLIENNVITARNVDIYETMGTDTHRRYVYGSNALTVEQEENRTNVYTAMVGRGKGVETTDEETGEGTGNYGRRLTLEDVEWSIANGDPVDKPKGQEWLELPEATKYYGYPDGTPRTIIQTFEDDEDPAVLIQHTYDTLVAMARPLAQMKATIAQLGYDAHLGDTIIIVRHDLNLVYTARIFKITRDLLNKNNTTVELGDYLMQSAADRMAGIKKSIDDGNANVSAYANKMYNKLRAEADERLKVADEKAAALEKELNNNKTYYDAQVESLTTEMNKAFQDAENKASQDLEDQLGTYKGQVTKQFQEYNDGYNLKLSAVDGRVTTLTTTVGGFQAKVDDAVSGVEGKFNVFSDSVSAKVSDANLKSLFAVQLGSITAQLQSYDGKLTDFGLTLSGIQGNVKNLQTNTATQYSQLSDMIDLRATSDSVKAQIDVAVKGLNASITSVNGKTVSLGATIDKITGWQTTVNNSLTGLKNQMTSTEDTWNEKITSLQSGLTTQIAAQVNKGVAAIDLKAAGGYLSLTGNGSTSKVWLGGDNLYLTGDTHVTGDFFLTGINNSLQTLKMTADGLFVNDAKGTAVGHIHENAIEGHPELAGLSFDLEKTGHYMSWAYEDTEGKPYTNKFTWYDTYAANKLGVTQGFHFTNAVNFSGGIAVTGAYHYLGFGTSTYNNLKYPYFGSGDFGNGKGAGIAYGTSDIYIVSGNSIYDLTKFIKSVNVLTNYGHLAIPTAIRSDGTVSNYTNFTF